MASVESDDPSRGRHGPVDALDPGRAFSRTRNGDCRDLLTVEQRSNKAISESLPDEILLGPGKRTSRLGHHQYLQWAVYDEPWVSFDVLRVTAVVVDAVRVVGQG